MTHHVISSLEVTRAKLGKFIEKGFFADTLYREIVENTRFYTRWGKGELFRTLTLDQ